MYVLSRETVLKIQAPFLEAERYVRDRFAARERGELRGPFDRLELDVLAVWAMVAELDPAWREPFERIMATREEA
jgi:hypothetical protein